ncbi:MAG: LysR family transcriptional regulator [Christensenellaceae bacterium]|jgi:DNA-binding transcriptional LysR family regulator
MNLLHLKYVVEVARTGSITQAADNLYMGQPNLSKAIRELEANLGITIFNRTPKGVIPTKMGEEFLQHARAILLQVREIENLYGPAREENQMRFQILVPRDASVAYTFGEFIAGLDAEKSMQVDFRASSAETSIERIVDGENTMGIIRHLLTQTPYFTNQLKEKGLESETLRTLSYQLTLSRKSPLAKKKSITNEDIAEYIEIISGHALEQILILETKESKSELSTKRWISANEWAGQLEILSTLPNAFLWTAPLPEEIQARYGLIQKDWKQQELIAQDVLVYPKGYRLTELERTFVETLREL